MILDVVCCIWIRKAGNFLTAKVASMKNFLSFGCFFVLYL